MPHVVFVCEHGAAKSVLAATYFNHLAERRGFAVRAVARGTAPDSEIPRAVAEGLAREGLTPCTLAPTALATEDLVNAGHVVIFDQPQVKALGRIPARVIRWNGLPPVSADFGVARDAIFARVRGLIAELGPLDAGSTA
jgi:arsenate reductase (thioredoxin)